MDSSTYSGLMSLQLKTSNEGRFEHLTERTVVVLCGVGLGLCLYVALDWVTTRWLPRLGPAPDGDSGLYLVLDSPEFWVICSTALVGLAMYASVRFPTVGVAGGSTMLLTAVVFLLVGSSVDAYAGITHGLDWSPWTALNRGAREPIVTGTGIALLVSALRLRSGASPRGDSATRSDSVE